MKEYTIAKINQRFTLLSRYERRCVVRFLRETEAGHAGFGDLVSHLQKQEQTPDEREKNEIALHHNHLPQLATTGVIEYDPGSGTVQYHGDELVEALLGSIPETHVARS